MSIYLAPARMTVDWLLMKTPALSDWLGLTDRGASLIALLLIATCVWLLIVLTVWLALRMARQTIRIVYAATLRSVYRVRQRVSGIKTALVCKLMRERSNRTILVSNYTSVTFTDFDLAVLHAAAALGPAESTSAPELSTAFGLRPAQVQASLEKLARNKLLDYAFGATDGFDNYVLSAAGAAYFSIRPHVAASIKVSPSVLCD